MSDSDQGQGVPNAWDLEGVENVKAAYSVTMNIFRKFLFSF